MACGLPAASIKGKASYTDRRQAICDACAENANGICMAEEAIHPGKAIIANAVIRPELRCRLMKWGQAKTRCPLCDRMAVIEGGMCIYCRNKKRNTRT